MAPPRRLLASLPVIPRSTPVPTLVLVPTELERRGLEALGGFPGLRCELCGFGPVAAAARTAELVARHGPARVLLVGIAGSLDPQAAPVGSAASFARVWIDGLGAGSGKDFLPPSRLGFPQWEAIGESLDLAPGGAGVLLSVCSASATSAESAQRRERYPEAVAEDMEGFGAALACRLAGAPLAIVRGLSNPAGVRDRHAWRIPEALAAAHALARDVLARAERPA